MNLPKHVTYFSECSESDTRGDRVEAALPGEGAQSRAARAGRVPRPGGGVYRSCRLVSRTEELFGDLPVGSQP